MLRFRKDPARLVLVGIAWMTAFAKGLAAAEPGVSAGETRARHEREQERGVEHEIAILWIPEEFIR